MTRVWDGAVNLLFTFGALYLSLIVPATIWDVGARNLGFPAPIWLGTFAEYGMLIITMCAAPLLVRERGHVSMELIDGLMDARSRVRWLRVVDVVAFGVSVAVAVYAAMAGWDSFRRGEIDVQAVDIPRWLLFAVIVAGFILCAVEFARHVARPGTPAEIGGPAR